MLKFIGTGSAFNTALGNNSAYIKEGNKLFLIDCGSANFHIMKESGFLNDVEHIDVYITHTHADHVGSLADLIFYMYYCKGEFKSRVTVYAVENINVDDYLSLNGIKVNIQNKDYHCEYEALEKEEPYEIYGSEIGILPYSSSHVEELENYGLFICTDEGTSVYTGDSNYLDENINILFEDGDLDYLYVDTCSQDYEGNVHLSLFKLHQIVKKEHRDKVWCMHLDEKFDKELAKSLGFNVAEVEI